MEKFYGYNKQNNYQQFLIEEGLVANGNFVIKKLGKKEIEGITVPIFIAVDGTEYPAFSSLLHNPEEWSALETQKFIYPIEIDTNLTPDQVAELLETPDKLKILLARAL